MGDFYCEWCFGDMNVIKKILTDFSCTWSTNYKYPCSERIFVRNLGQNKFGFASFVLKETSLVEMCELSNSSSANASELFESSHISTCEVSNQTPLLKVVWPKFPKKSSLHKDIYIKILINSEIKQVNFKGKG